MKFLLIDNCLGEITLKFALKIEANKLCLNSRS